VNDVEFRLGRGYRIRLLVQGAVALVLAAATYAARLHMSELPAPNSLGDPIAPAEISSQWLAVFSLAYAAASFAVYAWRGQVSTRLTGRGIEIRRYRRRLVPWQAIRDVETISYDRVAYVPVANNRTRTVSPRDRGPRTVAAVQIVRTGGHRIQLPAPLVTRSQDDPDFNDKARLIKARWQQAVTGTAGHLDYPASY
jgi:Bacterial PH domain